MKILSLTFYESIDETKGWRISHKENGTNVSSICCEVAGKEVRASSTKKMQALLDETPSLEIEKMGIVPLCNKALLDAADAKNAQDAVAIYVTSSDDSTIAAVKLDNCATIASRVSPDKKEAAFIVLFQKSDWRIRIYQEDKKLIMVNKTGVETSEVTHNITPVPVLKIRRLLQLPKKVFVTRFQKGEKRKDVKSPEGYIVVGIAQVLSKNTLIAGTPEDIKFDTMLSDDDKQKVLKAMNK